MTAKAPAHPRAKPIVQPHPFDTSAPSISRRAIDQPKLLSGDYWGELRTFLWVAKTGSLSRAADLMGSSHATVGREIHRLQDQIGSQLVVSTKNGTHLTAKGRALVDELLRLDQRLFSIATELRAEQGVAEGTVRLGITDGLGVFFLVPELRRFSANYPRIQIHMKSPGNFRDLHENQTDVILGFNSATSNDMTSRALGWLHFVPIATQSYINRVGGHPTDANLHKHFFVDSEIYSSPGTWSSWHNLTRRGTVLHYCDASISYGMMVKAGLGIGLIANYNMTEPSARHIDLGVHIALQLHAAVLTERLASKPVRIVFDLLDRLFGVRNPWFAKKMVLAVDDAAWREGHKLLFNL